MGGELSRVVGACAVNFGGAPREYAGFRCQRLGLGQMLVRSETAFAKHCLVFGQAADMKASRSEKLIGLVERGEEDRRRYSWSG